MRYLLDTNHVSALLRGEAGLVLRFRSHTVDAFAVGTPVLGELYFGAFHGRRTAENLQSLQRLLATVAVLPYGVAAAERYGLIARHLRTIGRPIPEIDI